MTTITLQKDNANNSNDRNNSNNTSAIANNTQQQHVHQNSARKPNAQQQQQQQHHDENQHKEVTTNEQLRREKHIVMGIYTFRLMTLVFVFLSVFICIRQPSSSTVIQVILGRHVLTNEEYDAIQDTIYLLEKEQEQYKRLLDNSKKFNDQLSNNIASSNKEHVSKLNKLMYDKQQLEKEVKAMNNNLAFLQTHIQEQNIKIISLQERIQIKKNHINELTSLNRLQQQQQQQNQNQQQSKTDEQQRAADDVLSNDDDDSTNEYTYFTPSYNVVVEKDSNDVHQMAAAEENYQRNKIQ